MAERICPWYLGYFLISPLRKFMQNPKQILSPYTKSGMTALDIGCGMGFFSLPLARMVGSEGKVVCIDLQEKMLSALKRRAKRARLANVIEARLCSSNSLGIDDLAGTADLALAIAVVHETQDAASFFTEVYSALKQGGKVIFAEPNKHVTGEDFTKSLAAATGAGFKIIDKPEIRIATTAILVK